jgi:hypothetical protein
MSGFEPAKRRRPIFRRTLAIDGAGFDQALVAQLRELEGRTGQKFCNGPCRKWRRVVDMRWKYESRDDGVYQMMFCQHCGTMVYEERKVGR